jgi:hypothetical protein
MSGDLPVLGFLEKLQAFSKTGVFLKMVSMSGDLPVLRFLEKLHAFSKEWSRCRVTYSF